jgi:DNA repair protein SbcC/Rad50
MKPIRLVVQAFGPYADVQIFDFRDLGSHTFFLIHGDTGAGKSTILDAVCYALYGDSSGGERTGLQLRSHHAPASRRTSVLFEFAIGANSYRVTRSPEHERPKLRGTGIVTEQQTARIWLRTNCEDEQDPGEILGERWEEVNRQVIELLGFQCNQFRQVVVLPQGQFRDFLIAPSGDREAILSVLFKTDEFRTIERALKEAANAVARELRLQSQRLTDLYQRAAVSDLAALQRECAQRIAELETLRGQIESLRAAADESQRQLQQGQEAQRKLNEREQAEQALTVFDAQQAEVDAQQLELDQGRRAAALADIETAVDQRLAEAQEADLEREQARLRYTTALTAREQAREALVSAEQREPDIEQARLHLTQLHEIAQRTAELEDAIAKRDSAAHQVQTLAQQRSELQGSLGEAEASLQAHDQAVIQSREIATQAEACQLRLEHVSRLHQQRERLEVIVAELTAAEQAEQDAMQLHANAVAAHEEAQQSLEQVEHAWYAGQAGVLAQQLIPGSPCPVCGGHDHPLPAVAAPDVPTETALKRQRDALRKQEKVRQDQLQVLANKQRALAEVRAQHTALVSALGEHRAAVLDTLRESLERTTSDVEAARAAQEVLPEQERAQTAALTKVAELKEQLALREIRYGAATTEQETARAVLAERERSIPEHLRTREAIDAAVAAGEEALKQLITALEQAQKQAAETEAEVAGTESAWSARVEASDQACQRAHEQQLTFVERLAAQGFVDRETYRAAKRLPDALKALALRISTYERERAIAVARCANAVKAVEGILSPALDILATAAEHARQGYESALQRGASLAEQLTQSTIWCDEAEQLSAVIEQLQRRYQVIGDVARIANGDNPYRMSFQRFVLAALLDEVLINASHRLQAMSRGRYTLQRALGQLDRRSAGGLELEVLDLFTGRTRLAKTLSGGESFLASLALALGLADVVQSRTGGIHLETMFIDEGFGSLDERMLDQALQTLSDLQQGGRLVGVISHVTELQRRIVARLEVHTSPSGSTANFVIGSAP